MGRTGEELATPQTGRPDLIRAGQAIQPPTGRWFIIRAGAHTTVCSRDSVGRAATLSPFAYMNRSGTDTLALVQADSSAACHVVGATARSLQQIMAFVLPVRPAFALPTGFFQPWFSLVQRLPSSLAWRAGQPEQWPALCAAVQSDALALPLSHRQLLVVDELLERLAACGPEQRFAVRSSSPDEDTARTSFAGLYASDLGVELAALTASIRRCFAACLDYRVVAYKAAQGIHLNRPSMALIGTVRGLARPPQLPDENFQTFNHIYSPDFL